MAQTFPVWRHLLRQLRHTILQFLIFFSKTKFYLLFSEWTWWQCSAGQYTAPPFENKEAENVVTLQESSSKNR